jgi:hypothetical protein
MNVQNGAISDPRTPEAKAQDYQHIAGSVSVNWKEIDLTQVNLTSQRLQDGSYSCIFQTMASMLEKLTGKIISATPYFWRKNYPDKGAYLQDGGDVFYNRFSTTEALSPSQNQTEVQMNQIKPLTTFLGITGYRSPAIKQIDLIAEAIEGYGQCGMTYVSNAEEYNVSDTPKYLAGQTTFGHAITGLAYGLRNGVKTIVCRDSARPSGITYITEDFHKNRNTGALYFLGAKDVSVPQDQQKIKILKQMLIVLHQALINLLTKK